MTEKEISKKQIETINYAKNYLDKCKKSGINVANSSFCYFAHYTDTLGGAKLKLKVKGIKYILIYFKILILNLLGISSLSNYVIIKKNINYEKYSNLIISNVSKQDFKKDGSYFDTYFQTSSKKIAQSLWFLNSVDNYVPKNFDSNLIIFARKNNLAKHNFIFLINSFLKTVIKFKFSVKKIIHEFSVYSQFSNIIAEKILLEISKGKFKKVINSYEAQPFQNNIFKQIKAINKDIKTLGFFHTALPSLPASLIYRSGAPDHLMISGKYSKIYLTKYLGWPKKKVRIVPSFRHNKKNVSSMSGYVYLPYNFLDPKKIIDEFEKYLKQSSDYSLNFLKVKNHMHTQNSSKHKNLITKINSLIKIYKKKFNFKSKERKSIIIGSSSAVIVALEKNIEVVHICEDPIFQSFNKNLWKTLNVKQISDNIFTYKRKINNSLLEFSNKNNMLSKYIF